MKKVGQFFMALVAANLAVATWNSVSSRLADKH